MNRHSRRRFVQGSLAVVGLGLLSGCSPLWRPRTKVWRIGYLGAGTSGPYPALLDGFRQGLRDLGYVEGQTIEIEYRFTDEGAHLLPGFADELVQLNVDLIAATGGEAVSAAKNATAHIPIVGTVMGPDPVGTGFVASLARPGGNVTGLSTGSGGGLTAKKLQLLKELKPSISRVVVLGNPNNPFKLTEFKDAEEAAPSFGLQILPVEVRRDDELDGAFRVIAASRPDALMILQDPLTAVHSARITAFALEQRLPAVYEVRLWSEAGGLMNYGINSVEMFRRAATYVDKIFKGARPADLPVEQPSRFELVINLRPAEAIGLKVPDSVLAQASEIIR